MTQGQLQLSNWQETPPSLAGKVSEPLAALVDGLLQRSRFDRPADAGEVFASLSRIFELAEWDPSWRPGGESDREETWRM
jgi:hypothetical protein